MAEAQIEHVVAVMYENRAFDHLLGHLKKFNPNINGLDGNEANPLHPSHPSLGSQRVSFDASDTMRLNPGHSIPSTFQEMFGTTHHKIVDPAPMNGFIAELIDGGIPVAEARHVMKCFNQTTVPTLSRLALEYAVFDSWFSSVPGPTFVNRAYAWCATSNGYGSNSVSEDITGFTQRSIFRDMQESNVPYKIYFGDVPTALVLDDVRLDDPLAFRPIQEFAYDAANGQLPAFSWIDPRYFSIGAWAEQDQHPAAPTSLSTDSVKNGDLLLKWIYNTLRGSPKWNNTALLVYYDEHGGLYDHVSPPLHGVPNPDGIESNDPPFKFDRLGVRIPAVLVSPRVALKSILRPPQGRHFEHTSLLATIRALFPSLIQRPLTKREAWAADFANVFDQKPCGRNCPAPIQENADDQEFVKSILADDGSIDAMIQQEQLVGERDKYAPTDLQHDMINAMFALAADHDRLDAKAQLDEARTSSAAGALFCRRRINEILKSSQQEKINK